MSTVTPRRAETLEESSERRELFCLLRWKVRLYEEVGMGGVGFGGTYCSRSYAADIMGGWL